MKAWTVGDACPYNKYLCFIVIFFTKRTSSDTVGARFVLYFLNNVFDNRKEALEGSDVERLVGRMQIKHDGTA